ncbi:hypothetical protein J3B02_005241, partial [Coemansia erecta]
MVTWSEDGIIEIVHHSSQTLRSLSILYSRSTQAFGLVESSEGLPVVYPQLESLTF